MSNSDDDNDEGDSLDSQKALLKANTNREQHCKQSLYHQSHQPKSLLSSLRIAILSFILGISISFLFEWAYYQWKVLSLPPFDVRPIDEYLSNRSVCSSSLLPSSPSSASPSSFLPLPLHRPFWYDYSGKPSLLAAPSRLHPLFAYDSSNVRTVCLRELRGRFGNKVYQLMFAAILSKRLKYRLDIPNDGDVTHLLIMADYVRFHQGECPQSDGHSFIFDESHPDVDVLHWMNHPNEHSSTLNFDLSGWFQFNHSIYTKEDLFDLHRLLAPKPHIHSMVEMIYQHFISHFHANTVVIAMHYRGGDFIEWEDDNDNGKSSDPPPFARIPIKWYAEWVNSFVCNPQIDFKKYSIPPTLAAPKEDGGVDDSPRFIIIITAESRDEFINVRDQMSSLTNIPLYWSTDLFDGFVNVADYIEDDYPLKRELIQYYWDWWLLTRVPIVVASQSSFSFSAAVFNQYFFATPSSSYPPPLIYRIGPSLSFEQFHPWNVRYLFSDIQTHFRKSANARTQHAEAGKV